jgi:hypothetical protein
LIRFLVVHGEALGVKLLDQTTALTSAVFVRHKTDGSDLETIGATYIGVI